MSLGANKQALMGASGAGGAGGGDFYTHQIVSSLRNSAAQDGTLKWTAGTPTSSDTFTMSYWVKRYNTSNGGPDNLVFATGSGGGYLFWGFQGSGGDFSLQPSGGNWSGTEMVPNAGYRDTSAWYHHVLTFDSTNATQADRLKIYVNGERITSWSVESVTAGIGASEDFSFINQSGNIQAFGGLSGVGHATEGSDVQLAEIVFNDGQAYGPDSYGETKNGVWIPKDPSGLTFGNNGYWLKMASGAIGTDSSGNGNTFTVANLPEDDVLLDSPTFSATDGNGGNFCTWNPLQPQGAANGPPAALSEGNLLATNDSSDYGQSLGTMGAKTGKWYAEYYINDAGFPSWLLGWTYSSRSEVYAGSNDAGVAYLCTFGYFTGNWLYLSPFGSQDVNAVNPTYASFTSAGTAPTTGDIIMSAMDFDAGKAWYGMNGEWGDVGAGTGNPATAANPSLTWTAATFAAYTKSPMQLNYQGGIALNAGQDPTFFGNITAGGYADDTGYGNFKYDVPAGFLSLCTGNLPTAAEVDPAQTSANYPQKLYNSVLYTGNGGTAQAVTGVGFKPDWLWGKVRSAINESWIYDSTRGSFRIVTDDDAAQVDYSAEWGQFDSDGWTFGNTAGTQNANLATFIGRSLRANGGTTASNGNGSITSTVQADPSGGFSIVSYTGYDSTWDNMSTVGHGLSSAPDCILLKPLTHIPWEVFFGDLGGAGGGSTAAGNSLVLNNTAALYTNQTYRTWGDVMPTSTYFTVNGNNANAAGVAMIAYCFANTEGYIKSGVYEGNGNADGTFVYCGFRPALIMTKSIDSTSDWQMFDNTRVGYNVDNNELVANSSAAETTTDMIDILSNGFKFRIATDPNVAETYVYLAIAHNPFQYATAR